MASYQNRIRDLRKAKGYTLVQMSKDFEQFFNLPFDNHSNEIKLSPDTISKYERGEREPKLETWEKLAEFFSVSVPFIQGISSLGANRIKQEISKKNINESALSERLTRDYGYTVSTNDIINFENGFSNPPEQVWENMADYFGVSKEFLRGDDLTKNVNDNKVDPYFINQSAHRIQEKDETYTRWLTYLSSLYEESKASGKVELIDNLITDFATITNSLLHDVTSNPQQEIDTSISNIKKTSMELLEKRHTIWGPDGVIYMSDKEYSAFKKQFKFKDNESK